jgi:hypothetical protein
MELGGYSMLLRDRLLGIGEPLLDATQPCLKRQ